MIVRGICIKDNDALLHARPARGRDDDQGGFLEHREPRRGQHRLAGGDPHRAAHKAKFKDGDDRSLPADPAMRDNDRVAARPMGRLRLFQAVAIAPAVAKAQRVDDRLGQFDAREVAIVEQDREAPRGADAQMVAAVAANVEIGVELAVEQHLLAARTLFPQIVRHVLFADDGADLGQNKVGEPAHPVESRGAAVRYVIIQISCCPGSTRRLHRNKTCSV